MIYTLGDWKLFDMKIGIYMTKISQEKEPECNFEYKNNIKIYHQGR